jgi:hypothetical protein
LFRLSSKVLKLSHNPRFVRIPLFFFALRSRSLFSEPYNLLADIYSFAILLWELVALDKAFGKLSQEDHKELVIKQNERPPLKKEWTPAVTYLLTSCWKRDPAHRVSSKELHRLLKQECTLYYEDGFVTNATAEDVTEKRLCI